MYEDPHLLNQKFDFKIADLKKRPLFFISAINLGIFEQLS